MGKGGRVIWSWGELDSDEDGRRQHNLAGISDTFRKRLDDDFLEQKASLTYHIVIAKPVR